MGMEINTDVSPHLFSDANPGGLLGFSVHGGMVCDNHPAVCPSEQGKLGIVHFT